MRVFKNPYAHGFLNTPLNSITNAKREALQKHQNTKTQKHKNTKTQNSQRYPRFILQFRQNKRTLRISHIVEPGQFIYNKMLIFSHIAHHNF